MQDPSDQQHQPNQPQQQDQFQQQDQSPKNPNEVSPFAKRVFKVTVFSALGITAFIYLLNFNSFSETEMVQMSFVWIGLLAFGLAGLFFMNMGYRRPFVSAALVALISLVLLELFFIGIFPAL